MADLFRTLIIPAAQVELARGIAAAFGPGGVGMWTTGLSADGKEPATHYISSGYIPAEFVGLAPCKSWGVDKKGQHIVKSNFPGDAALVAQEAAKKGLKVPLAPIQTVFAAADASDQDPHVAMARAGLKIINPTIQQD
jgi:hypothetical protein